MKIKLTVLLFPYLLLSCSVLTDRSFISEMEGVDRFSVFRPGENFPVIPGDRGRAHRSHDEILARTPLSDTDRARVRQQEQVDRELDVKLSTLGPTELRLYRMHQDYLPTAAHKIYYLELPLHERESYAALMGYRRPQGSPQHLAAAPSAFQHARSPAHTSSPIPRSSAEVSGVSAWSAGGGASSDGVYVEHLGPLTTRETTSGPIWQGMSGEEVRQNWGQPSRVDVAGRAGLGHERWLYHVAGRTREVYFSYGRVEGWRID